MWLAIARITTAGFILSLWTCAASAHGLTPHLNNANTILFEQDGTPDGSVNHNHLYAHDVRDRNDEANHHSHDGYAAWHNRVFITEEIAPNKFWHGFIEENLVQPRYKFTETDAAKGITQLTAAAQAIVNAGFDLWETRAHEEGAKVPGRRTGIDFDNDQTNFEFSIMLIDNLIECRGALAEWLYLPGNLNADTADGCPVAIGNPWSSLDGTTRPGEPLILAKPYLVFDDDIDWAFIALDSLVAPAAGKRDFATIALHEEGHVVGLDHTPGNHAGHIMRASIALEARDGNFLRKIELDSAVGAAELYTVAPEPASLLLLVAGVGLLARRCGKR
jgi:hypothetical protein